MLFLHLQASSAAFPGVELSAFRPGQPEHFFLGLRGTAFNGLDPPVTKDIVDGGSSFGIWMEHPQKDDSNGGLREQLEDLSAIQFLQLVRRAVRMFGQELGISGMELRVRGLFQGGLCPGLTSEYQGDQDDGGGPDVERSRVVFACT